HTIIPLLIENEKTANWVRESFESHEDVLVCCGEHAAAGDIDPGVINRVGVLCRILQLIQLSDGSLKVFIEGRSRHSICKLSRHEDVLFAQTSSVADIMDDRTKAEALRRLVVDAFQLYCESSHIDIHSDMIEKIRSQEDPGFTADIIVSYTGMKTVEKQLILEEAHVVSRLENLFAYLEGELEIVRIQIRLKDQIKQRSESGRTEVNSEQSPPRKMAMEFLDDEISGLERQLRQKNMPQYVLDKALNEVRRLRMMPPMSAEATVIRSYIDWFISLPWKDVSKDKKDILGAQRILDQDHFGLEKVKERIIEYLAVQHLVGSVKGPILCLVGPPGVGKTSLGRSIARATGRRFVRVSLGGVRDEAEIKGHRRTYIGSMPGKIIQGIRRAGTSNPVFLLDEIDKMSVDFRGDPSAALLEVLDPEQNYAFNDHYMDVDYDVSKVMFITTANTSYSIPPALKDRMEIIRLEGYTSHEKYMIARDFLISKQLKLHGLEEKGVRFTTGAIYSIIHEYTKEAGVRALEKEISSICRKIVRQIVSGREKTRPRISSKKVGDLLGIPRYRKPHREEKDLVGLVNGLAWTEVGGVLLSVETTVMPGKGKLLLTGKLGEVMQESAQAGMSYVRSRARELGLEADFYDKLDIHIHIPEGAVPKDGPSAGITMATSIVSALTKKPVRSTIAMTGELTLGGRVLPVGGLKEKLLAAKEAGMEKVLIPVENEKDLHDTPKEIMKGLEIHMVENMDEIIAYVLN
ncbi:MAG: endopeptidase La, partial [Deltaproteobacteria bacterium]|nr:endopeptidase La [Deltaproteobacteria bacterium]